MYLGSIESDLTAAGRVYSYLKRRMNKWCDAWWLTVDTKTTAISTRISEVRHQLPPDERIEKKQVKGKFFYRLVKVPVIQPVGEQLALGV